MDNNKLEETIKQINGEMNAIRANYEILKQNNTREFNLLHSKIDQMLHNENEKAKNVESNMSTNTY